MVFEFDLALRVHGPRIMVHSSLSLEEREVYRIGLQASSKGGKEKMKVQWADGEGTGKRDRESNGGLCKEEDTFALY